MLHFQLFQSVKQCYKRRTVQEASAINPATMENIVSYHSKRNSQQKEAKVHYYEFTPSENNGTQKELNKDKGKHALYIL